MNFEPDLLESELRSAIRRVLTAGKPIASPQSSVPFASPSPNESRVSVWPALVELGVLGYGIPVSEGGYELGQGTIAIVCEEMGRVSFHSPYLSTLLAADCVSMVGPQGTHWEKLRQISSGSLLVSYVVPHSAGVLPHLQVEESRDSWVVCGEAGFTDSVSSVRELLIAVRIGDSDTLFLVPADRRSIHFSPREDTMEASLQRVTFDEVRLGREDSLGEEGSGQLLLRRALPALRLRQAAFLTGLAEGAHREAVRFASTRQQFQQLIIDFQSVRFKLAALLARIHALKLKVRYAAWLKDNCLPSLLASTESLAMAAELALHVTREALHLHGAFGMTQGSTIQRYYRTAALEAVRYGSTRELWCEAGRLRIEELIQRT